MAQFNKVNWNREDLEYKLLIQKLSYKEIAKSYGITSESAVLKAARKLDIDLSSRKIEITTKENLYKLLIIEDRTYVEIGKLYGVSEGAIRKLAKKYNIELPNRRHELINIPKDTLEKHILIERLTYEQIGRLYGVSKHSIQKLVKKLSIIRPKHGDEFKIVKNESFEYVNSNTNLNINSNNLPVPSKYYNYKIQLIIKDNNHTFNYFYVPELNKWYSGYNTLKYYVFKRLGINFLEWECRWILNLPIELLYSDLWIERKLKYFYSDKLPNTLNYIKNQLKTNPNYVCDFLMVKEDLIELYNESRKDSKYNFNYDFTNTEKIIKNKTVKFKIFVNEVDPRTNNIIGEWETNYIHFIVEKKDNFILSTFNKRVIFGKKSNEEFLKEAKEIHGDRFTYLEEYIDYLTPIKMMDNITGEIFKITPCYHLHEKGGNPRDHKSNGENLILTWIILNGFENNYEDEKVINGIYSRNSNYVRIDYILNIYSSIYWIEYNGEPHYKDVRFFNRTTEEFNKQLERDQNVRDYCKENNIFLIEIPYILDTYEKVKDFLDKVILQGIDPNTLIDYKSLYKI